MLRFSVFTLVCVCAASLARADGDLTNLHHPAEKIWSGATPDTDADFAAIAKLGVRIVVSVDGAKPQVERAARYKLRYVHIPIGYDGVPAQASLSLVRLMGEEKGPFYFHCHHGKHRGPTMAAIAALISKSQTVEEAVSSLKSAGTSPDYVGLWNSVRNFKPPKKGEKLPELVESAKTTKFRQHMAMVGKQFERVRALSKTGWRHESGMGAIESSALLHQALTEAARLPQAKEDNQFEMALHKTIGDAFELRALLKKKRSADALLKLPMLMKSCTDCHAEYR